MTEAEIEAHFDSLTLALVPFGHAAAQAGRRYSHGTHPESGHDRLYRIMRSAAKKVNALPEQDRVALGLTSTLDIVFGPDPDVTIDAAIKRALERVGR